MYCAQTIESIIMRFSPDCSPAILVFSLTASHWRRVDKSHKIRPKSAVIHQRAALDSTAQKAASGGLLAIAELLVWMVGRSDRYHSLLPRWIMLFQWGTIMNADDYTCIPGWAFHWYNARHEWNAFTSFLSDTVVSLPWLQQNTNVLINHCCLQISAGHPTATLKIWRQSLLPFPNYKQTKNTQTYTEKVLSCGNLVAWRCIIYSTLSEQLLLAESAREDDSSSAAYLARLQLFLYLAIDVDRVLVGSQCLINVSANQLVGWAVAECFGTWRVHVLQCVQHTHFKIDCTFVRTIKCCQIYVTKHNTSAQTCTSSQKWDCIISAASTQMAWGRKLSAS